MAAVQSVGKKEKEKKSEIYVKPAN